MEQQNSRPAPGGANGSSRFLWIDGSEPWQKQTWQVGAMESSVQDVEKAVEASSHLGSQHSVFVFGREVAATGIQWQILWTFAVGCGIACGLSRVQDKNAGFRRFLGPCYMFV